MSFLGLPGGRMLVAHLEKSGALVVLAGVAVLAAVAALTFAPRLRQLAQQRRQLTSAAATASAGDTVAAPGRAS
jgi:hypothetical protein